MHITGSRDFTSRHNLLCARFVIADMALLLPVYRNRGRSQKAKVNLDPRLRLRRTELK